MKPKNVLELESDNEVELSFDEMINLSEDQVKELLREYEVYKAAILEQRALEVLPTEPTLLLDCIHYLRVNGGIKVPGIFRVNGDLSLLKVIIQTYKTSTDINDILLSFQQKNTLKAYDVASTMKSYFRTLKEPVVPYKTYEAMKDLIESPPSDNALVDLYTILKSIKQPNRNVFAFTMMFFQEIVKEEAVNQMSAYNLATCLTMSIMRFPTPDDNALKAVMEVQTSTKVLQILLLKVDFKHIIDKKKYFKLLKGTKYRASETLPRTLREFTRHPENPFRK